MESIVENNKSFLEGKEKAFLEVAVKANAAWCIKLENGNYVSFQEWCRGKAYEALKELKKINKD